MKYTLNSKYEIVEIDEHDEDALTKEELRTVIRNMIGDRNNDNKKAELKITALRAEITETENEIKKLNHALNSIPYLGDAK